MLLFVGLGNTGKEFKNTRHNVGFEFIDFLVQHHNFVKKTNKLKSIIYKGDLLGNTIILSKPTTMMNCSGEAVKLIKNFYKINTTNIFIFHDELDLETAKVKFKFAGTSAGHNGIKSIDTSIGNQYFRIRIGIKNNLHKMYNKNYVLGRFSKTEQEIVNNKITIIEKNVKYIIKKDINNFMNIINN